MNTYKRLLQDHFAEMTPSAEYLYEVDVDKDALWDLSVEDLDKVFKALNAQRKRAGIAGIRGRSSGHIIQS